MTTNDQSARREARDAQQPGERDRDALKAVEAQVSRRLQYIRVAQQFAEIANSSDSTEEGVAGALACFCRGFGWPIGHAYTQARNVNRYVDSGIWWTAEGLDCGRFIEASAKVSFEPGQGFVGRVVESAESQWVGEEIGSSLISRSEQAKQLGLKCGIAFPILVRSRVAGVLEFFSIEARRRDRELFDAVVQFGAQLGRVVEREEFERDLARVSQEERCRLGRELHDSLSQQLTGIGMLARSLERKLADDGRAESERARNLFESIQEARQQLRAVARGLNPVDVDAGTLSRAVAEFMEDTAEAFHVRCRFEDNDTLTVDDDFTANQLFCIIREAVHNAAKHAQAGLISVDVAEGPDRTISLCVRDDGKGFDMRAIDGGGMGLRTLRYRSRLIGARLRIESAPAQGTSITCTLKGSRAE